MKVIRENTSERRQIEAEPNQIYVDDICAPKLDLSMRINPSQTVLVISAPKEGKVATVLLNDDSAGIALAGLVRQEIISPGKLIIIHGNRAKSAMTMLVLQTLQTRLSLWDTNVLDVNIMLQDGDTAPAGARGDTVYVRQPGQGLREVSFKALAQQANES